MTVRYSYKINYPATTKKLTRFGNQTKFWIFLRNYHDCMVVDPYKARKTYTVTESLDLIVSVK